MKNFYPLLNLGLLACCVAVSQWLLPEEGEQKRKELAEIPSVSGGKGSGAEEAQKKAGTVQKNDSDNTSEEGLNIIAEKTLFRPQRNNEFETSSQEKNEDKSRSRRKEMELIGIGRIADDAVAFLRVRGRRKNKEGGTNRSVFRQGDSVGQTGYRVKEIALNEVVLQRGDEERILALKSEDGGSKQRIAEAEQAQEQRERKSKQEKKEPANNPPPPPPPPGGEGKSSSESKSDSDKSSRRERLRKLLKKRKELLEKKNGKSK